MPFLRVTRDKRGIETTYVMHTYRSPQGSGETRVLYLFRSPANVAIGRRPLDDEARAGLEHTHPDLTFDWPSLTRELGAQKAAPAPPPRAATQRPARHTPARPAVPAVPSVPADDQSVLARVLGPAEALRLRTRYRELADRIGRRARSPEERTQLLERLQRLNPDDWADESAVRAAVSTVDAEWDALATALPARRRGRRGGRRGAPADAAPPDGSSGIIAENGEADAGQTNGQMADSHRDAGAPGDDDRGGGAGPGDGLSGVS